MVRSPEQISPRPAPAPAAKSAPEPAPAPTLPPLLPKRRWPHRLLITLNVFVAMSLLSAGGGYGYFAWKFGNIRRIPIVSSVISGEPRGKVMNVLLVGSDTRSTLSKTEQKKFGSAGRVGGSRSDTMMILHVDPNEKKAAVLSIPRDLYVPSVGDRINTAFDKGPQNLIDVISQTFGIPIDHYVEVDFNGFRGIVKAVGDINVYFPAPARDAFSGLTQRTAGCISLGSEGALAYVRSRNYQYFEGGRWHNEGDGDLGRIQRQQDFIRRVLRKVKGVRDPFTLNKLIDTGVSNVTLDAGMSLNDILDLSKKFKSLSPDTVDMQTLPTVAGSVRIGGQNASILRPKQPEAQQIIDRFTGKAPEAAKPAQNVPAGVLPSTVRVRVLNGSGVAGQATKVSKEIGPTGTGMNIAGTGDAEVFTYNQSVISYGPGQLLKAQLLQAVLKSPAQVKSDSRLKGVDLVLVVGTDYAGTNALGPAQAAVTSTTAVPPPTGAPAPGKPTGKSPADSC